MPTEIIALMIVVTLLLEDQIVKKNRGNRMGLCLCAITDIPTVSIGVIKYMNIIFGTNTVWKYLEWH